MKTKNLFLCLLFLVLGTTAAWADKYYQPGSYRTNVNQRLTLERALNSKFMIYNTAIDGNVDRTGFLRNNGVQFELDKSKERDLYVYNESFVYTMEKHTDGTGTWYAIKSVNTGLYVDINGKTDIGSAANAKLYITDWDNATGKSGVNMESWKYNIIANGEITSGGHGSTVFVVKNGDTYWNGNTGSFATYSKGHPFAFYIAHEVTNGDYLQDLHIYSRSDIFSAQQTYGYVQYARQITSSPSFIDEGGFGNLIDGEATTYNVTDWNTYNEGDDHYYQIDLETSVSSLYLYMQRRADGKNAPVKFELQASTDGSSYTKIGDYTTELGSKAFYTSPAISLNGSYRYLRIVARETTTSGFKCVGFSELYVLPTTKEVTDIIGYINAAQSSPIYTKATAKAYAALVEEYNRLYSDARLLSGVPIPGNKYRIYADTYDRTNQSYVNREIMADGNNLGVVAPGTYNASAVADKKKHEWYCEQTTDGKLVFRNVADPTKYLAYGGVTVTPYKWSINTVHTHHYGVPLMNENMQYLAVANNGTYWQGDVKAAQDQTQPYTHTIPGNTEDDDPDNNEDRTETIEIGLCTDFLFIPVPLDAETEKKVTITAGELAQRNTQLLYDGKVYPLPFSLTFRKSGDAWVNEPTMELLCSELHSYAGVKVNNGETLATTSKVTLNGTTLSFNLNEIDNGDVLDIQLTIKKPFEFSEPDMAKGVKPTLYIIKNMRPQSVQQQARPQRAAPDIEIGGGDGDSPISSQTGAVYYAKFDSRNSNMSLVQKDASFDAHSLFYFTATEDTDTDEYYSARIHNVTTVMKCASDISWNTNGNTWFVQPNKTASYTGYNIATTKLTAKNNPNDTWCSNHADGDRILRYNANDDGSAWEFVAVEDNEAKTLLYDFIADVADALTTELEGITAVEAAAEGYDMDKITNYISIVGQLKSLAKDYYDATNIAKLVQYAQNIHMIEHEIDYALYALPELTDEENFEQGDFSSPHWYYIRNVMSDDYYVAHAGDDTPMSLGQCNDGKALKNMFYFVGEKNTYATGDYKDFPGNNLIIDEYLKAHVHNFVSKRLTLVSKNVELSKNDEPIKPGVGEKEVVNGLSLDSDEDWSIELEYDFDADFQAYNAYGSCLLASTNPLQDSYNKEFQIYFKDDRSIVIKVNNGDDRYRFWHTQDHFTHIKVVITYSQKNVTLDVYNSFGEKETMVVKNVTLNDITSLHTALPATGATITNLATYQVESMTWKGHEIDASKDVWYILPSSNLEKKGMAIVLEEPNDLKMGWANAEGGNSYVATDLGTSDYATWKFERVTDFRAHLAELLAMYDFKDCVIYDRELAALMRLIMEKSEVINANADDRAEEAAFNEIYYAILNYTGRMPEELMAPKAGSLYTIRPVRDEERDSALVVYLDKTINDGCVTKEVYNADAIRKDNSYDSRAAWMFEGTANGDYLALNGLNVKNIHTQCYLTALGENSSVVNEVGAAEITLAPLGACTTKFQVGGSYMGIGNEVADAEVPVVSYSKNSSAFGSAIADENVPSAVKAVINEKNIPNVVGVFCKEIELNLAENGKITVVFKHTTGDHKLNILGVALIDASNNVVQGDYHWGKAGGAHVDNVYELHKTAAHGNYTLRCYVFSGSNDNDDVNLAAGTITVKTEKFARVNNTGTAETKWIVEEIKEPATSVYYETEITDGYSTLMLGFNSTIPAGVEAYYGRADGPILEDRYLSMTSYEGGVLPAMSPVVLKNAAAEKTVNAKFYYTATAAEKKADNYMRGSLYFEAVETDAIEEEDYNGNNVNIYMLLTTSTGPTMVWVWEEFDEKGDLYNGGSNDEGGHVICKANKAYIVLRGDEAANASSLLFNFRPGTTGIVPVGVRGAETSTVNAIYDLQGRKLSEITQPGIYIVNGKKVMVK